MDTFNVPRAGYFHCCIIHNIEPHEWHQIIFATFYARVPVHKWLSLTLVHLHDC